jgi:hypothetical protein
MSEEEHGWEGAARALEWLVPWRYEQKDQRWFVGGYANLAVNAVDRHLTDHADQVAIRDDRDRGGRQLTFRELYTDSARLARWWREAGVGQGTRVMLYGEATLDLMVAWMALTRLGAVVVRSLATLDGLFLERVGHTEVSWVVVSDDTVSQVKRLTASKALAVRWLKAGDQIDGGAPSVRQAIAEAPGLLDAVPVESNVIGLLLYGDDPHPYAYAGTGIAVAVSGSLIRALPPKAAQVVLASDNGGMLDAGFLTTMLWVLGIAVIWQSSRSTTASAALRLVNPVTALTRVSEGDDKNLLVVAPDRRRLAASPMDLPCLLANPALGLYDLNARAPRLTSSPGSDRVRTGHGAPEPDPPRPEWCAALKDVAGVKEVVAVSGVSGWDLWIASDRGEEELLEVVRTVVAPWNVESYRLIVVPELPETVEGHVATTLMTAIARQDARLSLGHVKRADTIPPLVERLFRAPMMLG